MKPRSLFFTFMLALCATVSHGQELQCALKLSQLEVSIEETGDELRAASERIQHVNRAFLRDDTPDCPSGLTERMHGHQKTIEEIGLTEILESSERNLICAQFFTRRIASDIATAENNNDTALVSRLVTISARIGEADALATRQAADARSLVSKSRRIKEGATSLTRLCGELEEIYE